MAAGPGGRGPGTAPSSQPSQPRHMAARLKQARFSISCRSLTAFRVRGPTPGSSCWAPEAAAVTRPLPGTLKPGKPRQFRAALMAPYASLSNKCSKNLIFWPDRQKCHMLGGWGVVGGGVQAVENNIKIGCKQVHSNKL